MQKKIFSRGDFTNNHIFIVYHIVIDKLKNQTDDYNQYSILYLFYLILKKGIGYEFHLQNLQQLSTTDFGLNLSLPLLA